MRIEKWAIKHAEEKGKWLVRIDTSKKENSKQKCGDMYVYRDGIENALTYKPMVAVELAKKCRGVAVPVAMEKGVPVR